jgi:hypothetical protein
MDLPNKIIEIKTLGPQGPVGPSGPQGPAGPGFNPGDNIVTTGYVSASEFYGDGSNLTGVTTNTGSFIVTASSGQFDFNTIRFTKGDGSTFSVYIPTPSPSPPPIPPTVNTSSFFTNATLIGGTLSFTRGDGSFLRLTLPSAFPYTGSAGISGSLNVTEFVSASTYYGDGSNLEGIEGFPYTGSAKITGSLEVTGSLGVSGSLGVTGSITLNNNNNILIGSGWPNLATSNSVAIGHQALAALTTGTGNTAIGYQASNTTTTGTNNTVVGYSATPGTISSNNIVIGYEAGNTNTTAYGNSTYIGYRAGRGFSGDDDQVVLIGSNAGELNFGAWAVGVGFQANYNTSGYGIIGVGHQANRTNNGAYSISIGYQAGYGSGGENAIRIGKQSGQTSTGTNTIAIGAESLKISTANDIVAIGHQTLINLTTGTGNTALGYQAGLGLTTGINNTILGYSAGGTNNSYVTVIGYDANTDGNYGVAIGWLTKAGEFSTSIGTLAGGNSSGATYNVFIGDSAGRFNNGDRNVIIGKNAGYGSNNASDSIFIGYQAGYNETGSNKLYIENSDSTSPLIYGEFDNNLVRINGRLETSGSTTISGSLRGSVIDITPTNQTASLNCSLSNFFTLTLSSSANTFLTASNIQPGQTINLRITQPATSGSLSYGSEFKFPNGLPYSVSATGSVVDILSFIAFDSNTLYGSSLKNFV